MKHASAITKNISLDIVGGTSFGQYPKVSSEQTVNMMVSDNFLVPFPGYKQLGKVSGIGQGRGIYNSTGFDNLIMVIADGVYVSAPVSGQATELQKIGSIDTFSGDVFFAENNAGQIAICDKQNIYIFNYLTDTFLKASTGFRPVYVEFQNGYFIAAAPDFHEWRLSDINNGLSWPAAAGNVGLFQTQADTPVAAIRMPGTANRLLIIGSVHTEIWYDLGYQLFPYQKNTQSDIGYGTLNSATIAKNESMVVWLASNQTSGPTIMVATTEGLQQITDEGINFKFDTIKNPNECFGFLYRVAGHVIYQFTFTKDNFTYCYDFKEKKFYTLTDDKYNFHIAKSISFFNNSYYFVSYLDGGLYELHENYPTYDVFVDHAASNNLIISHEINEIPRIRITKTLRMPDSSRFIVNALTFPVEQGQQLGTNSAPYNEMVVDLAISVDGGQSFGNYARNKFNHPARRPNRLYWWNLGMSNELVFQFRFWGHYRFLATNGEASYYQ